QPAGFAATHSTLLTRWCLMSKPVLELAEVVRRFGAAFLEVYGRSTCRPVPGRVQRFVRHGTTIQAIALASVLGHN
ncbi:MAG: hypothetical protein L0387_35740, partial [Acidobacteria bacterium]|nr:hypothetical protein [Acidobacteriota bacterium]